MSSLNLDLTTDQIVAEFYIEGTTGGPAVGNIAVLNLDGNVGNVLRGDGTWGIGGGGGTANVAGSNGQLQYNNAGNLGAITGLSTNGVKLSVNTAANFSISGGSNGQMIITDGSGNLSFATIPSYVNTPRVELTSPPVFTTNPSWTHPSFAYYNNNTAQMNIFVNGVLADPSWFVLANTTLTYQNGLLANSAVDVLPQAVALSSVSPTGNINAFDITCNSITGDGSGLTNIPAGSQISNTTTAVSTLATGNISIVADGSQMMNITDTGVEVNSQFIPASDDVYTLGSPTRRWNHLYIGPNSMTVGNTTLSETTGGGISIGGEATVTKSNDTITVGNIVANTLSGDAGNVSNVQIANITGIGNIAVLDVDGNVSNVLTGNGTFVKLNAAAGNTLANYVLVTGLSTNAYEIQYNNSGNIGASSKFVFADDSMVIKSQTAPPIIALRFSNTSSATLAVGRARGTSDAPLPVQVGDSIGSFGPSIYTGNGTTTIANIPGWVGTGPSLVPLVDALPSGAGLPASISWRIFTTTNTTTSQQLVASFNPDKSTQFWGNVRINENLDLTGTMSVTGFKEKVAASVNTGTAISPDAAVGTVFQYTANSNFTFNGFTNPVAGQSITVIIKQDGTGSRLMTSTMKFAGNVRTLSTAANSTDLVCVFYSGTEYLASLTVGYL